MKDYNFGSSEFKVLKKESVHVLFLASFVCFVLEINVTLNFTLKTPGSERGPDSYPGQVDIIFWSLEKRSNTLSITWCRHTPLLLNQLF